MTAATDTAAPLPTPEPIVDTSTSDGPLAETSRGLRVSTGVLTGAILIATLAVAMFGSWFAPHPIGATIGRPFANTSTDGWLGTDGLGRDVWSQILHGGRRIVLVPLLAAIVATTVGALVGLVLARRQRSGVIDAALTVVISIPGILVLLLLLYRFGDGAWVLIVAVLVVNLPFAVRYSRATAQRAWLSPYVEQAELRGETRVWVLTHEVAPNVIGPVLSDAGLRFVGSVYLVTSASFLGFGPGAPATDWASMISDNASGASLNVWALAAPAVMIALLTVPANLLADRLAARIEG